MKEIALFKTISGFFRRIFPGRRDTGSEPAAGRGRVTLGVGGMSCASCERRIESVLARKPGVRTAKASLASGSVTVEYDPALVGLGELRSAIDGLGYEASAPGPDGEAAVKRNGFTPLKLLVAAALIGAAWLLLNQTGVFNAVPVVDRSMGYGLLFVIGLLTSIHCVAMCGGINLSQSARGIVRETTGDAGGSVPVRRRLLPAVLYNAGRLVSYTVIGGAVGALGSVVSFSGHAQAAIVIAAGAFMIVMGVNMLNVFPRLRKLTPRLPKALSGRLANAVRGKGPFLVGLLNGFMPCGPLQSMQLYALATGSFIAGAASMFLFALGTVPLMFAFGAVSTLFSRRWNARMMTVSALLVLFLGAGMIVRGLNLSGVGLAPAASGPANVARLVDGRQEVVSRVTSSSYEPIIVQAGVPVRWTLRADANELNGCNNAIVIPALNVTKKLAAGDNTVEFTPATAGNVTFTCWMGMISSTIRVVNDLTAVKREDVQELSRTAGQQDLPAPPPFPEDVTAAEPAVVRDGVQSLTIEVGANGYRPAVSVLKRGVKTKITFRLEKPDRDNYRLFAPRYNARAELTEGDNVVDLVPDEDFFVVNWTSLYTAVFLVADDPVKVANDKKEIETRIGQLKARY